MKQILTTPGRIAVWTTLPAFLCIAAISQAWESPQDNQDERKSNCIHCAAQVPVSQELCGSCWEKLSPQGADACKACGLEYLGPEKSCTKCKTPRSGKNNAGGKMMALQDAVLCSATIQNLTLQAINTGANAVYAASAKGSGGSRIVTTGTLTQSKERMTEWAYTSTPTDRLRVVDEKDQVAEFVFGAIQGDTGSGVVGFFTSPHRFQFHMTSPEGELKVLSSRGQQGNWSASEVIVSGKLVHQGKTYAFDVKVAGKHYVESSTGGSESNDELTWDGTATSSGFSTTIHEIRVTKSIVQGGQRASSLSRTFDNRWTLRGVPYKYRGTIFKTFMLGGRVSKAELQWKCQGVLLRNEEEYGSLRMEILPYKPIRILLDLPKGSMQLEYIPL